MTQWLSECSRQVTCVISGNHYPVMKLGESRIFLQCDSCGKESPGWVVVGKISFPEKRITGERTWMDRWLNCIR